jgi:hypothetical protein
MFGAVVFASVAIVGTPASVMSQSATEKVEQRAKGAAREAKTEITDSWVTATTKIALFADERVG